MSKYRNPALRKLADQQVKYATKETKLSQIDKAESFIHDLEYEKDYPYTEVFRNITEHDSELYPQLKISGNDLAHDIRCFVEDLSGSIDLSADQMAEEVLTVNDLSERMNVSTKTVDRWREKGLVSRRLLFGNRKRVAFLRSSVDRFLADHGAEITRKQNFSRLTELEKEDLIRRARTLVQQGKSPTEISRELSPILNRSPETIRYTMLEYDRQHPELALFPDADGPLSEDARNEIFRRFKRGTSAEQLSKEYERTVSSIYRIVKEVRAQKILDVDLSYIDSEEFHLDEGDDYIEGFILGEPPVSAQKTTKVRIPPDLPPYLASLYEVPLLTKEQEVYYFRKMNYLKFKATRLCEGLNISKPSLKLLDEIEGLLEQSIEVKNFLIRSNLRLVVSIAKKHMKPHIHFFEMVSDGNMSLIKAIEKFDYSKGNKFSTYATWAIMKNYARSIPQEAKIHDRFRTGTEEVFTFSEEERANPYAEEIKHTQQRDALMEILEQLDTRERDILIHRFGLEKNTEPLTLEQVGRTFGVTKERIRQIESRALRKLKKIAQKEHLEIPGIEL